MTNACMTLNTCKVKVTYGDDNRKAHQEDETTARKPCIHDAVKSKATHIILTAACYTASVGATVIRWGPHLGYTAGLDYYLECNL